MDEPLEPPCSQVAPPADWRTRTIHTDIFTSAEEMAREAKNLWPHVWTVAARVEELSQPGDYVTTEVAGHSLVVVRQLDGQFGAFYNVCQHRAHPLVPPGAGNARAMRCPYHAWVFGLDGALLSVPDEDRFCPALDKSAIHLTTVRSEVWADMVWVNLSATAQPLRHYLGSVADELDAYHLEDYAAIENLTIETACNWKLQAHAQFEFYHIQALHAAARAYSDSGSLRFYLHGSHVQMVVPFGSPRDTDAHLRERGGVVQPAGRQAFDQYLRSIGVDKDAIRGVETGHLEIQQYLRGRSDIYNYSELADNQLSEMYSYTIFPNVCISVWANIYNIMRFRPHATDPGRSYLDYFIGTRVPRGEARPPFPKRRSFAVGQSRTGIIPVLKEDLVALEAVQKNLTSPGYNGPHLFAEEMLIQHYHDEIARYVARDTP